MESSRVPTTQPPYRSCHLYAGCRSDSKQVTSELVPHSLHKHGFDITHCISTHHQWFPYGHLLYGHLTVHHCLLNVSFTTLTLSGESSIHRFATSSCKAIARDLLSSVSQLRMWQPYHILTAHCKVQLYLYIAAPCTNELHPKNQWFTFLVTRIGANPFLHLFCYLHFSCFSVYTEN